MPRVREHHHEGHQRSTRLADGDLTEVRPVALGLFAGKVRRRKYASGTRPRPQARDHGAEVIRAAAVTALAHHDVQTGSRITSDTRSSVSWMNGMKGSRIDGRVALLCRRHAGLCQHAAHRGVMQLQLPRDRADRPAFGVMQTAAPPLPSSRVIIDAAQSKPHPRRVRRPSERRQRCMAKIAPPGLAWSVVVTPRRQERARVQIWRGASAVLDRGHIDRNRHREHRSHRCTSLLRHFLLFPIAPGLLPSSVSPGSTAGALIPRAGSPVRGAA